LQACSVQPSAHGASSNFSADVATSCAPALTHFDKQKALAEDETYNKNGCASAVAGESPPHAIELRDFLELRRIDSCNRFRCRRVGPRPLPDR